MDPKIWDQAWLSQIDMIFKNTTGGGDTDDGQVQSMKGSLRSMAHKRMRIWWNKATLENYLSKGLIPRGLRMQVFPSFTIEDDVFKTKWEEACGTCSKTMMELLIGLNKKQLDTLETEIEVVRVKLVESTSTTVVDNFKKELEQQYVIWEKEIQEQKVKKLQRDLKDLQQNKMYRWSHNYRKQEYRARSQSVSSISSAGSSNTTQAHEDRYPFRHLKRKGGYDNKNQKGYNNKKSQPNESSRLQVINLSDHVLTETQKEVLSLGLNFSPTADYDLFTAVKDLHLFARKLVLKKLHNKLRQDDVGWTPEELRVIDILEGLESESTPSATDGH